MTGNELREKFLQFFADRGHQILPSASLIPANDPSILWTAAGMVPFKPFFTGAAKPEYKRATTCQKCLRTPDIEEVGKTARHHTFFEMLGNFSFGDYFKEKAIPWAWEFVTRELGLPKEKLWISIYENDDEAYDIWHKEVGIPAERIVRLGKDTNFWEIGVGPCGPCSEIYIDLGEHRGCGSPDCAVGCDCDRYLEIWNLVFIQFFRDEEGNYTQLKNKGIDTGMGLERVASVLQKVKSNFDTDLLREIMDFTARLVQVEYGKDEKTDLALKVIADHCRAVTFAIGDGALPSNEGRGYVIRRLIRRAVRFGRLMGEEETFLHKVADAVVRQMSDSYPELKDKKDHILKVILNEEKRFGETLAHGTEILNRLIEDAKQEGRTIVPGPEAFQLYDTYGFPLELTQEIAEEQGLSIDIDGFNKAMENQRERARSARQETEYISEAAVLLKNIREERGQTNFVGYNQLEAEAKIIALIKDGQLVESAQAGEDVEIIMDITPCYAESGGQVSDYAKISSPNLEVMIYEVTKPIENLIVHKGKIENGLLKQNDSVRVEVSKKRRLNTARNHSATHLLHKSLKEILGEHVNQAGSLVEPDRLRFDFTHYSAVSHEDMVKIERLVNKVILANLPIETFETGLSEAREMGAAALFGEKYGERVRVVKIGDFSMELCGGTHLHSTAEVGLFKLISESSVGSGLRRIEAVTGDGALKYVEAKEQQLAQIAQLVKTTPQEVVRRVEALVKSLKDIEHETENLRAKLAKFEVDNLLSQVKEVNGINILAAKASAPDMDSLRGMADLLREQMKSGVVLLATANGGKVNLVAAVTKDLMARGLHAGKLIKEVAQVVGGGGGGRPDMAQAGGKDPSRIQEAIAKTYSVAASQILN
ncbi:alanine--tRNA ligase [Desulfolucanica intricata]|uniref:alanine--tRNA ligase n=1 Tax=Desulfolucanica intricata TaxID=1285191 RepID=UPI00082B8522|nr:alanine--tRNA ligase [Desulfolucanica intricata]